MKLVDHLRQRNFEPSLYCNIACNHDDAILTVYLYNLSGQLVGYQQYNPNSTDKRTNVKDEARYFTYRTEDKLAVWGLETLDPTKPVCFVVEGIFKASALHKLGLNAIAVLCNNPKQMRSWFEALPYRLIAIGDNDKAGEKLIDMVGEGTRFEKDVDEYSFEELRDMMEYLMWEI